MIERETPDHSADHIDKLFDQLTSEYPNLSPGTHVLLAQLAIESGNKTKSMNLFEELSTKYPNINSELVAQIAIAAASKNIPIQDINTFLENTLKSLQPIGKLAFFKKAFDPVSASLVGDLATQQMMSSDGTQVLNNYAAINSGVKKSDKKMFSYYNDYAAAILCSAAEFADTEKVVSAFTQIAKEIKTDNEAAAILTLIHTKYGKSLSEITGSFKRLDSSNEKYSAIIVFAAVISNTTVEEIQNTIKNISEKYSITKEIALRLIISKQAHILGETVILTETNNKSTVYLNAMPITSHYSHVSLLIGNT